MSILAKVKEATNKVVDNLLVIKNAENDVETSKKKIEDLKSAIEAEKLVLDTRKSSLNTAKSNLLSTLDEIKEGGLNERQIKLAATQLFEAWVDNGLINTEEEKVVEKKEVTAEKPVRVRKAKTEVSVVPSGSVTVVEPSEKDDDVKTLENEVLSNVEDTHSVVETETLTANTEEEVVVVGGVIADEIASEESEVHVEVEKEVEQKKDEEVEVETVAIRPATKTSLLDDDDDEDEVIAPPALSNTTIRPKVPAFIKK